MKKLFVLFVLFFVAQNSFALGDVENLSQELLLKQKEVSQIGAPESSIFYECYLMANSHGIVLGDGFLKTGFLKDAVFFLPFNRIRGALIEVDNYSEYFKEGEYYNKLYKCVVLYRDSFNGKARVYIVSAELINAYIGIVVGTRVFFNDNSRTQIEINKWPEPTKFKLIDLQAELAKVDPPKKREWLLQKFMGGYIFSGDEYSGLLFMSISENTEEFEEEIKSQPLLKIKL
jgi:hypothetical protein